MGVDSIPSHPGNYLRVALEGRTVVYVIYSTFHFGALRIAHGGWTNKRICVSVAVNLYLGANSLIEEASDINSFALSHDIVVPMVFGTTIHGCHPSI